MDASVQSDLTAEGITRDGVEVVEDQQPGELQVKSKANQSQTSDFTDEQERHMSGPNSQPMTRWRGRGEMASIQGTDGE